MKSVSSDNPHAISLRLRINYIFGVGIQNSLYTINVLKRNIGDRLIKIFCCSRKHKLLKIESAIEELLNINEFFMVYSLNQL